MLRFLLLVFTASLFSISGHAGDSTVRENPDGSFSVVRNKYVSSGGHKTREDAQKEADRQNGAMEPSEEGSSKGTAINKKTGKKKK